MKIDGLVPSSGIIANTNGNILNKLKPGDSVRAQVLENTGNDLSLKLADGSVVSASARNPVDAQDGEYVNFVFKGIVDGKPELEVTSRNVQPQIDTALENIKNTLTGLNLPVTDKNVELAQALQKQNLPVNAENMSKTINLISKNNDLKPDSAAFLTASNLSNNQNSIDKLQNLLAGRLKISNDIGDLLKLIGSNANNSTEAVNPTIVNKILEKLANEMAAKGQNQLNSSGLNNNTAVTQNGSPNNSTNASTAANANLANNTATTATVNNTANTSTAANSSLNANTATSNANNVASTNGVPANATLNQTNKTVNNSANINISNSKAEGNMATGIYSNNAVTINNTATINPNNLVSDTTVAVNNKVAPQQTDPAVTGSSKGNANYIEQQISNLLKGGESLGKADLPLLSSIYSQLESAINSSEMSTEELSATKLIAKEIDAAIFKIQSGEATTDQLGSTSSAIKNFEDSVNKLQNLFIKIDLNSDEINPVKLYKNMDDALQALKISIQQLPVAMQETAMHIVSNLESNVNFINQLNSYSSYVQIPLSIFNQNTTGELFMLKRGSKHKKLDASNMTVLISLDTSNIGRIDTLLSVDKKNISTNFRLENSEVFDVLKENHKLLYTSLLEKGFRLVDFTYRLMEEPISIVNFEEEAKKEFIKNSNNINVLI